MIHDAFPVNPLPKQFAVQFLKKKVSVIHSLFFNHIDKLSHQCRLLNLQRKMYLFYRQNRVNFVPKTSMYYLSWYQRMYTFK